MTFTEAPTDGVCENFDVFQFRTWGFLGQLRASRCIEVKVNDMFLPSFAFPSVVFLLPVYFVSTVFSRSAFLSSLLFSWPRSSAFLYSFFPSAVFPFIYFYLSLVRFSFFLSRPNPVYFSVANRH